MQLVTNDNHTLKLDPVRMISLRGCQGVERERKIVAAAKELTDMIDISTFERCPLPRYRHKIATTMLLPVKHRADGTFLKDKGRLVVQGFRQVVGKDFVATFSPMESLVNVRLLLFLVCTYGWRVMHADVRLVCLAS